MPARDYLQQNLATLKNMLDARQEIAQRHQAAREGYAKLLEQNPNLAAPEVDEYGLSYDSAVRQTLQGIVRDAENVDPERVKAIIISNPLLRQQFGANQGLLNETANRLAKRTATGTFDPLVDEDPAAKIQAANVTSPWKDNPLYRGAEAIFNDIADPLDALQSRITGSRIRDKNRTTARILEDTQYLNNAPSELKTAAAKVTTANELKKRNDYLKVMLRVETDRAKYDDIAGMISVNDAKIKSLTESLSDAEKQAFNAGGEDYLNVQQRREYDQWHLNEHTPRYASEVEAALNKARFYRENGISEDDTWAFIKRPELGVKYFLNHISQPSVLWNDAAVIAPWVALGISNKAKYLVGALNVQDKFFNADEELMADYFDKHGTLDGYNSGLASLMNAASYIIDLYGGNLIGKLAKNNFMQILRKEIETVAKPALEASKATGSNAPLLAAFKVLFNDSFRLDKLLSRIGNAAKEKAFTVSQERMAKGLPESSWLTKGLNIAGTVANALGAADRTLGQPVKHALTGSLTSALENAGAEYAQQIAAQNGINPNEIVTSGIEGLTAGPLGLAEGLAMQSGKSAVSAITHKENKYLRTPEEEAKHQEEFNKLNARERYEQALSETEHFNKTEEKVNKDRIDSLGAKLAKKHENLTYDKVTRTLNAVPGTVLTEDDEKALQQFNKRKASVQKILDTIGERRDFYSEASETALEEHIKESGVNAYSDATIRSALAKKDEADIIEMLKRIKNINDETAALQAKMLTNRKASVSAKDIGITEDAYNTSELLKNDSTLLTDIKSNTDAQKALGDADFAKFYSALDKQIADNNADIAKLRTSAKPDEKLIQEKEAQNKRLEQLKNDYTQDKWDNKKNVVIGDKDTEDYMRKLDKDIIPDRKALGITDEPRLGLTADQIENALSDIRAKGTSKDDFINSLMKTNAKHEYIDATGNPLSDSAKTSYLNKFGKIYDDFANQLNENIKNYNIHQQYKTFSSKETLEKELEKARVSKAFHVKETKNKKGEKEYYATLKEVEELDEAKLAKKLQGFIKHPTTQTTNKTEFDALLNLDRNKEIIKNTTHKNLFKRIAAAATDSGSMKPIKDFNSEVFYRLDSTDQKTVLNALKKAYERSVTAEQLRIQKAIKGWGEASLLRRFTGGEYSNSQKRNEAYLQSKFEAKVKDVKEANKQQKAQTEAVGGTKIDKFTPQQLTKFATVVLSHHNLIGVGSLLEQLRNASDIPARVIVLNQFAANLQNRSIRFDRQLDTLLDILNKYVNKTEDHTVIREIYYCLNALRTVLATQPATEERGTNLWNSVLVESSQRESFTQTNDIYKQLWENLEENAHELDTLVRSTDGHGFNFQDAYTNTQAFVWSKSDNLLESRWDASVEAVDNFNAIRSFLTAAHEDFTFSAISNYAENNAQFWQILNQSFITRRREGAAEYSKILTDVIRIADLNHNSFVAEFLKKNANDGVSGSNDFRTAFHNLTEMQRKDVMKIFLQSNLLLAALLIPANVHLNTADPMGSRANVRITQQEFVTARDNFLQSVQTARGRNLTQGALNYASYVFTNYAEKANLLPPADAAYLRLQTQIAVASDIDRNVPNSIPTLDPLITAGTNVPGITDVITAFRNNSNRALTLSRPTYNQLNTALANAGIPVDEINWIMHNYGKIIYHYTVQDAANMLQTAIANHDIAQVDALANLAGAASKFRYLSIPHYTERRSAFNSDNVSAQDFEYLRSILRDNNYHVTLRQIQQYSEGHDALITEADFNLIVNQHGEYNTSKPVADNSKLELLAKAMCNLIAATPAIYTDAGTSSLTGNYNFNSPHGTSLNTWVRERAINYGIVREDEVRDPQNLDSMLDYANGWDQVLQAAPELADNDSIKLAMNMSRAVYGRIKPTNHFCSSIETVDGQFTMSYLNKVAAIAANFFPRFTVNPSDDFLDMITAKYNATVANAFTKDIMDKRTLVNQIGAQIAAQMGIRKNTPVYDDYCAEAGIHALIMLESQGLIENVYVNTVTGDVVGDKGKGKDIAGMYPAVRLTKQGEQTRIQVSNSISYINTNGTTTFILDEILDPRHEQHMNNDLILHHYDDRSGQESNLRRFRDEYIRIHGHDLFTGDIQSQIVNNTFMGHQVNQDEVYNAGELALVVMPPRGTGQNNHVDWYVYRKAVKSDNTRINDGRLATLAELMREGRYINCGAVQNTLGFLYNPATGACRYTENDLARVDYLCSTDRPGMTANQKREALMLRSAIGWEDPYKKGTSIYAGNIHNKNVNNFRQVIQAVYAFAHIQNGNTSQNVFTMNPNDQVRVRFDEINTVNNRLFVDSITANYREAKNIRGLFDNAQYSDLNFTVNQDGITASDLGSTFFHSLGLDADKMRSDARVTEGFINLLKDASFQQLVADTRNLMNNTRDPQRVGKVIEAVNQWNETNEAAAAADAQNDTHNALYYFVTKVTKHDEQEEAIQFKVDTPSRLSAWLNFCCQVTDASNNVLDMNAFAQQLESNAQVPIQHWTMRCEIDGLTNGPSIKANTVGNKENRDPFSKIMLGSVGINSRFINIFDAQCAGLLDVYLLVADFANAGIAEDIINKFVNSRGVNDKTLAYIAATYGKDSNVTNYLNVLNDLFDRSMIKYPVMYTSYGAGKANITLKMLVNFDKKLCEMLAKEDVNGVRIWLQKLAELTGENSFTFTYLDDTSRNPALITINTNGTITDGLPAQGISDNNIFSNPALLKKIAFEHSRNPSVKTAIEPVLTDLYEAMANNLDALNTPYMKVTESAQVIAEVFNEVVKAQIDKEIPGDPNKGLDTKEYLRAVHNITNHVLAAMGNVIHIGDQNGSDLRTMKDSLTNCITEALSVYVTTSGNKYHNRIKLVTAAKESLGAGNIPMFIHSYDSYIMHQFLNEMLMQNDQTVTSIHDAIIAGVKDINHASILNKRHYMSPIDQIGTFACVVNNLTNAKNRLNTFGLDSATQIRLSQKLQNAQNSMFNETLGLAHQTYQWLRAQRAKGESERVTNNQYSYRDRSVYRPQNSELDAMISGIQRVINSLSDGTSALPLAKEYITQAIRNSGNTRLVQNYLNKDGKLLDSFMKGITTVEQLVTKVNRDLHLGINLASMQRMINNDPSVQNYKEVTDALIQRVGSATPDTVTKANLTQSMNLLAGDPSIRNFVSAAYTAKNYYTKNVIFTGRDSDTEIQQRLTSAVLQWIQEGKPRNAWAVYELLRRTVKIHPISKENAFAFNTISTIINNKHCEYPKTETFDTTKDFTLHVSQDIDYKGLLEHLKSVATYDNLNAGNASLEAFVEGWYLQQVKARMQNQYKDYNGQVVFSLSSNMELLELRALQELKSTDALFKNIDIVIAPNISNITSINPELFVLQELAERSSAVKKEFVYVTAPSNTKSKELLSVGLGAEITEARLTNNNKVNEDPHIYVENRQRNGKQFVTVNKFLADTRISEGHIHRMDEWGYDDAIDQSKTLIPFDLQTTGVRSNSDMHYDFTSTAGLSAEDAKAQTEADSYEYHNIANESSLTGSINENLLGDATDAVLVNTTSDGDVLGEKVKTAYASNRYFQEAHNKFLRILQTRQEDYRQHKLINFSAVMMPVRVNIKTKLGRDKVFVFNPSLQTALTRQQLLDSFAEKGNRDVYRDQVLTDSPLYNMLAHKYKNTREGIAEIRSFILSKATGNPDDVIQIPAKYIASTYKEELNVTDEMRFKSAIALEPVLQDILNAGYSRIIVPYNNVAQYDRDDFKILPPVGITYAFSNFATRNSTYDRALNKGSEKTEEGAVNNLVDSLIREKKAGYRREAAPTSAQTGANAIDEVTTLRGYQGRVDQAALGTLQQVLFKGQDIVTTIEDAITEDTNRGIDVSVIREILPELQEVNSAIALYTNNKSVTDSFSLVMDANTIREHNAVSIGSKLVGTTSKAEVIAHEICHTLFRHLGKEPKLLRQTQEIYDYIQRNLTLKDFADGDTPANRAVMEAVFGEKTPDNVEECLCYYMTNKAFQQAVDNMSVRKNTGKIHAKVKSILQRIIEFIHSLFTGTSVKGLNVDQAMNEIFQECIILNNKYWENKNYLKNLAVEDLNNKLDADLNAVIKAGSSATEKLLDAASHKGLALAVHDQSYVDLIADETREFCDIQSGFTNDLIASLQGVSPNQMQYLKIRLAGKKQIDKMREEQAAMINNLVDKVLKDVPAKTKAKLVTHFVKADVSCLFKYNEATNAYQYLTDNKARAKRVADLEASISTNPWYRYYKNAAKGLASALVTGFNPTGLGYRNAYEIVTKAGSAHQASAYEDGSVHNAVDELVTLYAIDLLEAKTPNFYKDIKEETFAQLSEIHNGIKEAENIIIAGNRYARLHVPKGELHISNRTHDYRVINADEYQAYKWAGFKKVSDAVLDPYSKAHFADKNYIMVKGLFKSAVPIEAGCAILTDVFKGRLKGGVSVDDITDENTDISDLKAYVDKRIVALNTDNPALLTTSTSGNLALHFNSRNKLSGANFEINQIDEIKQTNAHIRIGNALGNQYGSILERAGTTEVNTKVAQAVIDIYEKADDKENFEWISETSENEDYRDYYESVPKVIKDTLAEKYKDKGIPIRKSALNTFFGYKHLSANDTKKFIENERKAQANIDGLASNFKVAVRNLFYNKYVGYGEALARYLAKVGKENILIKGITTSWFNVVSNYILLGLNGLRPDKALAYEIDGINQFLQIRDYNDKLRDLNQKKIMHTYTNADARSEKGIRDALKKLPMYALYEKGLIGDTLAEDLTESDRFVMNTIDKYTSKGPINTVLHNAVMDPQGILYGILSDFASLGDVAGKYALYRYNKEKGMSEEEAQRRSLNAFIDYSNPLPKSLQLLDDIAVLPFMKYSVGIQNVIADALVRHPERSLAWLFANGTFDITNDVFDSLLGLGTLANKLQVPGKIFIDSLKTLPSVRIYDALT